MKPEPPPITLPHKQAKSRYTEKGIAIAVRSAVDPNKDPWIIPHGAFIEMSSHKKTFSTRCSSCVQGAIGSMKYAVGIGIADKETIDKRISICAVCNHATRNRSNKFQETNGLTTLSACSICKCLLIAKTKLKKESCPIGKW